MLRHWYKQVVCSTSYSCRYLLHTWYLCQSRYLVGAEPEQPIADVQLAVRAVVAGGSGVWDGGATLY